MEIQQQRHSYASYQPNGRGGDAAAEIGERPPEKEISSPGQRLCGISFRPFFSFSSSWNQSLRRTSIVGTPEDKLMASMDRSRARVSDPPNESPTAESLDTLSPH